MSKLLAMMMKPKNYMYATIKGSLTENNGVFSGFSESNYLALQQPFTLNADTIAEFCFKINLSTTSATGGNIILGYPNLYNIQITIAGTTPKIHLFIGNGNSWNIINDSVGNTTITTNKDYYIKLKIDRENVKVLLSSDNQSWTTEISQSATIPQEYIYDLAIGKGRSENQYLHGSIDLNQSYIKIANTKYQLQAVVGYTVVGTPTITDGVVSGFSESNYLSLPSYSGTIQSLEFVVKVNTIPTTITNNALILQLTGIPIYIYVRTNNQITLSYKDTNNTTRYLGSNSTIKVGYYKFVLNNSGSFIYYSANGSSWSLLNSYEYISQISISGGKIGYATNTYNVYDGSIDLKETYIKANNKLWFNGQPA